MSPVSQLSHIAGNKLYNIICQLPHDTSTTRPILALHHAPRGRSDGIYFRSRTTSYKVITGSASRPGRPPHFRCRLTVRRRRFRSLQHSSSPIANSPADRAVGNVIYICPYFKVCSGLWWGHSGVPADRRLRVGRQVWTLPPRLCRDL